MKSIIKQSNKKAAFTIVELLVVMSIIMVLMGILLPAFNMIKRYARKVDQTDSLNVIAGLIDDIAEPTTEAGTSFNFPPSGAFDEADQPYCGAMKLAEAMIGQDLLGFHPYSRFRADFTNAAGYLLYDFDPDNEADDPNDRNIGERRDMVVQLERVNACRLWHLYGRGNTAPFREDIFVLCDNYSRVTNWDTTPGVPRKIGMPILYYRANMLNRRHCINDDPEDLGNIYHYRDNDQLLLLGLPWNIASGFVHPMTSAGTVPPGSMTDGSAAANPLIFYERTRDPRIAIRDGRPHRADSYILISAGFDGLYGTDDDVSNFRY